MKHLITLLLCAIAAFATASNLVIDGNSAASIVVPEKPEKSVQFAAHELQKHIYMITGCKLPIIHEGQHIANLPIYLGKTKAAAKTNLQIDKLAGEEYIVKSTPNGIFLIGIDSTDYGTFTVGKQSDLPPLFAHNHGTLWAVYDFLHKACGVDWYAPGDNGITFQKRKTLAVSDMSVRRKPFMSAFRMIYAPQMFKKYGEKYSPYDVQLLKLRWKQTDRYAMGKHNVYSIWLQYYAPAKEPYWAKYFKERRPEYFARNYQGDSSSHLIALRGNYSDDNNIPPQLCNSNNDVVRILAEEAVTRRNGGDVPTNPGRHTVPTPGEPYYYPIEPDDNNGFCRCEKCLKLAPGLWKNGMRPNNYIHFEWLSRIAAEAERIQPGTGIVTLAYNTTLAYPENLKMPSNLSVMMVYDMANLWHALSRQRFEGCFSDWTKNEKDKRLLTVWLHLLAPAWDAKIVHKYNNFFPGFYSKEIAKRFKEMTANNIRGYFIESPDEIDVPYWYQHLELYTAAKIADDPSVDMDKLYNDFFVNYYGKASVPMKKFYNIIEQAYWNQDNYPGNKRSRFNTLGAFQSEDVNWGEIGTKARMEQLGIALDDADKLADTSEVKERLRLIRTGLWEPMCRGRAAWEDKEKYYLRPVRSMDSKKIANANGDLSKVNWNKATKINSWRTLDGFPISMRGTLACANDDKNLYLRYEEQNTKLKSDKKSLWTSDHFELFIGPKAHRPTFQIAAGANGQVEMFGHFYKNDIMFTTPWTAGAAMSNSCKDGKWIWIMVIPLSKISAEGQKAIRLNAIRVMANGKKACWSPLFSPVHNTPEKMGIINLK